MGVISCHDIQILGSTEIHLNCLTCSNHSFHSLLDGSGFSGFSTLLTFFFTHYIVSNSNHFICAKERFALPQRAPCGAATAQWLRGRVDSARGAVQTVRINRLDQRSRNVETKYVKRCVSRESSWTICIHLHLGFQHNMNKLTWICSAYTAY